MYSMTQFCLLGIYASINFVLRARCTQMRAPTVINAIGLIHSDKINIYYTTNKSENLDLYLNKIEDYVTPQIKNKLIEYNGEDYFTKTNIDFVDMIFTIYFNK